MIYPDWPAPGAVRAVTTTRQGGVSETPFDALNLADHVGDRPESVQQNRAWLRQRLGLPAEPGWLQQVHGSSVVACDSVAPRPPADAGYTDRRGVVCAVLTADCLPVLFCDRQGTRVAAAHAGWRGTVACIGRATVAKMVERFGCQPTDIRAGIGPSIGPCCYEVGDDLLACFTAEEARAVADDLDKDVGDAFRLYESVFRIVGIYETGEPIEDGAAVEYGAPLMIIE